MTMKLAKAPLLFTLVSVAAWAQVNVGEQKPEASLPFTMTTVTTFKLPWRLAFLPDGRMLVTEKPGPVWLVSQQGEKIPVGNTPPVYWQGRAGRRAGRLLARRPVSIPGCWRPPAHDPRPGSGPTRRQDPAPHAGRQTGLRQSQLRQNRRCQHSAERSAQ